MLTKANRLRSAEDFRRTTRGGARAGSATLVVHLLRGSQDASESEVPPTLVGFVVSKAVGPAVVRTRVKRRLRHLARERLSSLPGGSLLVVRANPAAAQASSAVLGADLDRCLGKMLATS